MLRCVLLVPPGPTHEYWRDRCAAYASKRGYLIVAVAATWEAAMDMVYMREVEVVVIRRDKDKAPDRIPRVESASETAAEIPAAPEQRRPIRRREGRSRQP